MRKNIQYHYSSIYVNKLFMQHYSYRKLKSAVSLFRNPCAYFKSLYIIKSKSFSVTSQWPPPHSYRPRSIIIFKEVSRKASQGALSLFVTSCPYLFF